VAVIYRGIGKPNRARKEHMPQKEKYGAFLLYVDDWLSSTTIELMSAAEERGYLRLLLHAWKADDCGLPDDDATLARLSKLGKSWSRNSKSRATLRGQFVSKDGRLYNERLSREREHQKTVRESRSGAGRIAAASRWNASRIIDAQQKDANSKLETQTINDSNRIEDSHMLITPERTERTKVEIGAHRRRGDQPDETIIRKILIAFDDEPTLTAWLKSLASVDPASITGNGYSGDRRSSRASAYAVSERVG
jgi:uncharacterized protein YdaU (DUF1376 family)